MWMNFQGEGAAVPEAVICNSILKTIDQPQMELKLCAEQKWKYL